MKTPKQLQTLSIKSIRPFPGFHKLFPPLRRIIAKIVANMRIEGFRSEEPIVVWFDEGNATYYIIDGHQRFRAAVELNLPVIWVAIALFQNKQEAIDYMFSRQMERRNINCAAILNALLNASLYTRGGARNHGGKVPGDTLNNGGSTVPASQQDIADTLLVSRRTVARCKRDYFDQLTPEEKGLLASGRMDIEDLIAAIDGRRKKPEKQSKIVCFFAQIGFTEAETGKLTVRAQNLGMTPLTFAAAVLRAASENNPDNNAPSTTSTVASGDSNPPQVTIDIEVSKVGESVREPLSLPLPSNRDVVEQQEKGAAKEKDWKQWHQCQKEVLWHFYASSATQSQTATASAYHDLEKELMGEKSHTLKAAEHEISRLVKQYQQAVPPVLTKAQIDAALQAIRNRD